KGEARERRADGLDHGEIPARPELELDARKPLIDRALDLLEQDVDRVLDAEVGADGYAIGVPAERDVQRHALAPGVEHPPRDLEASPRELVPLDERDAVQEVS